MATYDYPYYSTDAFTGDPYNRFQEWRDMMYTGERVVGEYGDYVGTIDDVFDYGFKIGRPYADDVYLPFDAIKDIHDGEVQLKIPIDQVGAAFSPYSASPQTEYVGPYTGYGPRNYQRTDERIRDDISDRMWADGQLDASGITVSVDDGVVGLDGTVDSRWAKRRADDIAWSVPGVVDVVNNLRATTTLWENYRSQLYAGMNVVGSLGSKIGTIGEIRDYQFLVNRPGESGLWIPFSAIQEVRNDRVILNVTRQEVNKQGWLTTEAQPA